MNKRNSLSVRAVVDADAPAICKYLSVQMGNTPAYWDAILQHWWQDNPAYSESITQGWLIYAKREIVGFLGNIPILFQFNGEVLTSYNPTTWFVSKSVRGTPESRQLFHDFGKLADKTLSFITTPARHVVRFYHQQMLYLNFPEQPTIYHYYVYDQTAFLKLKSSRKRMIRHGLFLPLYDWRQNRLVQPYQGGLQVRKIRQITEEFDHLWARHKSNYANTQVRDSATLQWFLSGHLAAQKFVYGCYRDDTLIAYGLFMRKQDDNRPVLECLDLWGEDAEAFRAILDYAIRHRAKNDLAFLKVPVVHSSVGDACKGLNLPVDPLHNYYMLRYGARFPNRMGACTTYLSGLQGDYALF